MKKLAVYILTIVVFTMPLSAKWVSLDNSQTGAPPEITVLESNTAHILFKVKIHGFFVDIIESDIGVFQRITIPDAISSGDIGGPELPELIYHFGIPESAGIQIREIERSMRTLKEFHLFPFQPPTFDNPTKQSIIFNEKYYNQNLPCPSKTCSISDPAILRDVRFVKTYIYPIKFFPTDNKIEVTTETTVEIIFDKSPSKNIKSSVNRSISPIFYKIYKGFLLNFDSMKFKIKTSKDENIDYLIIASDDLVSSIRPLSDWWTQCGLKSEIKPVSETGSTTDSIKSVINSYYQNEGIEYVLLVGELSDIPVFSFSVEGDSGIGDYDYGCLEGSDWYAEVAVGRILTDSSDTVSHIVARTLNYIQSPPDDGWLSKSILCAHEEDYPNKYTQCKNEIKDFDYSIQIPEFETFYPPEGATHSQVVSAIEDGRGIVNYRGHGSTSEWSWSIGWSTSDIYNLNNGLHVPVVWNICCSNAEIDQSVETLCEAWQNAGASGEGGAVANLGATRPSYTTENHTFDKQLYREIFDQGTTRIGHVVDLSRAIIVDMGDNGIFNARIYMLFGDPALDISTDGPFTMTVNHEPFAPLGESDFEVVVTYDGSPIENALVCLSKDDEYYESAYTNNQGRALLHPTLTSTGTMNLTVTSHNFTPYITNIIVEAEGCGAIILDDMIYNCNDVVSINVWDSDMNIDPFTPDTLTVDISSDSDPTGETVLLTETEPNSNEFNGTIQTSSSSGANVLVVGHDDTIVCIYHDADCDGTPRDVSDSASVDCLSPEISDVSFSDMGVHEITVSWHTNEASTSKVLFGTEIPPSESAEDLHFVTEHQMTITSLNECTTYYFAVSSSDAAGNTDIDDNSGNYFNLTTLQEVIKESWQMDSDPGWTLDGDWEWGQPAGQAGDPSSGYTNENVIGYNLNGSYTNNMNAEFATTPSFDCTDAVNVFLSFYEWLGVESASYDHASLEISNDGGANWEVIWDHTGGTLIQTEWQYVEFNITEWAAGYSDVKLRWKMGPSDESVTYCGWNLDDVTIEISKYCNTPYLKYGSHSIDDTVGGNGNGEINAGETIHLSLVMHNDGIDATGVSADISSDNPNISFQSSFSNFPDIPTGGDEAGLSDYIFEVNQNVSDGETIPFTVSWSTDKMSGTFSFVEIVKSPELKVISANVIDESSGDDDGVLDPGEDAYLSITLINSGHGVAANVSADITSDHPEYITISDAHAEFSDIPAGETGTSLPPHFHISAAEDTPEHTIVTFTVSILSDTYSFQDTFFLDVTSLNFIKRYEWNMDIDPGWLCEGDWAWGQPSGNSGDPASGYTGTNVYGYNLSGTYSNNLDEKYLTSNPIDCSGLTDVEVRFMRWLGVESSSWDHASFRVSNDGINWTTVWEHTGSNLIDTDWQQQSFDISNIADNQSSVYLRWVMGSTDTSVTYCGWNIDDVEIWGESGSSPPTPTPTPTNTVVPPTPTANPTSTPSPRPPTPSPTATSPQPTSTPTSIPPQMGMKLILTDTDLQKGDLFNLYFILGNPSSQDYQTDVYLLLEVYGDYWCWPSWVSLDDGIDFETYYLSANESKIVDVLYFTWPEVKGSAEGLSFIGCAFTSGTWEIIGELQYITWGYH